LQEKSVSPNSNGTTGNFPALKKKVPADRFEKAKYRRPILLGVKNLQFIGRNSLQ